MVKMLIADDNWQCSRSIINSVVNKIEKVRIEYVSQDGEETLDVISKNPFDIVLLDLQMPKMNGIEIIEQIQKLNIIKVPRIVIVSGDLPLIEYARINNIVSNIILKTERPESIYEKILRIVNEIEYDQNYGQVRDKTISKLKEIGYSLKHKGTRYMIDCVLEAYRSNNLDIVDNLEKNIYRYVAHKHHESLSNIKTNITKATKAVTKKGFDLSPKDVITEIVNSL